MYPNKLCFVAYYFKLHPTVNRKNSELIGTQSCLWSSNEGELFLVETSISTINMRIYL